MNLLKTITLYACALFIIVMLPSCAGRKKANSATITLETEKQESIASKLAKF